MDLRRKISHLLILLSISTLLPLTIVNVYGHGVGSEIFPPVDLYGKQVSLEVSSSPNNPDKKNDQQISISLIDFDSKITLKDVTFLIKSNRGEQFLFEKEFQSDNGFLVFNFISENTDIIQIQEENKQDFFGSLLGVENRVINVKGPKLSEGGLYKFDISILTVDSYSKKLNTPLTFNAGISIVQTSIPIIINHMTYENNDISIPEWIRNNAAWWSDGQIDDSSFVEGIQYLIKEKIMKIPSTSQDIGTKTNEIPSWIKNNAGWWADGSIDDNSFVQGIQYLIQNRILHI